MCYLGNKKKELNQYIEEIEAGEWVYQRCRVCKEPKLYVDEYAIIPTLIQFVSKRFSCENCGSRFRVSRLHSSLTDLIEEDDYEAYILSIGVVYLLKKLIMNPPLYILRFILARYQLRLIERRRDDLEEAKYD